ncbi:MAG: hypothetical protein HY716_05370 [Planctomycetes bacterium]|nr:hypothetical protein [Planctomycetota bacterium]
MDTVRAKGIVHRGEWRLAAVLVGLAGAFVIPACYHNEDSSTPPSSPPEEVELDEASVFFELNATDEDLGLHCFFDGEGWIEMTIFDPNNAVIFHVTNSGSLGQIGSTEVFTESAEPPFTELDPADFLAMFEEGTYTFSGVTVDGKILVGSADLEHQMPSMPVITTTPAPDNVDASMDLLVEWTLDPVLPGGGALVGGATIERFEVVVEQEDPLEVEPLFIFRVDVPAGATSFTVPAEALHAGRDAKVEVIAVGENGNKTAGEVELGTVN